MAHGELPEKEGRGCYTRPSRRIFRPLDQVQTILVVNKSADTSPFAFTVKCACSLKNAREPSDPCATALWRSVSTSTSTAPCLTALMFSESLSLKFAV